MPELFLYVSFLLPHQRFDIPLAAHDHQSLSLCEHVLRPRHGEQVPSMADGQDIDIVAGTHLALQDAVAGPAVRQLDLIDPVFRRQLHIIKDPPGCSVADSPGDL